MNILFVDHTTIYQQILREALRSYTAFNLVVANSGVEAVELAETMNFQFVIVAQHLPDSEGLELVRRLRGTGQFLFEPMILLTSSPSARLNEEAQMAGVTEVFRKHDIHELVNFLRRFLGVFSILPGRVLYAEDSPSQRNVLEAQLRQWGLEVDAFASGEEAWEAYQARDYDLIICDIVLEGRMSGSRLVNRVRRLPGHKGDVLILALTAFDSVSRRMELFYLGIDDYVSKPVIPLELRARIQSMLSRKFAADRTRLVLEATGLGVMVINEQGQVQLFNAEAERLFGYDENEAMDRHVSNFIAPPEDSGEECLVERYLRDEQLLHGQHVVWEARGQRKAGEPFPIQLTMAEVDMVAGSRQFALLARDISAEKELARTLLRAKELAEAANRMKSDFLANMSHEIRTPMNAIIGLTHLCLQTHLTPQQGDYLRKAHNAAQSLLGIINDILDLSKIEAGKLEMERIAFSPAEVVGNLADILQVKAEEKGLALRLELAPELPERLLGDPLRLGQVLTNLAGNAIKFTDAGSVTLVGEVVEAGADDVVLRFSVRDTGIGMTAEQCERLFQAFSQADSSISRKYGGTGLGLTISKRLVAMMDGDIRVDSTPGVGTTFSFTARLGRVGKVEAEAVGAGSPKLDAASIAERLAGAHLLLVEDNAINQLVARELLQRSGMRVTVAADGQQALDRLREEAFDGVLMDMQMPVMDGVTATGHIRAMPEFAQLPIIAMTANAMTDDVQRCLDAGMNDHIAKPIEPAKMLAILARWIVPAQQAAEAIASHVEAESVPAEPPGALPGVRMDQAILRMGGEVELYWEIVRQVRRDQAHAVDDIRAALLAGERDKAERLAHTLKGLAATIGAEAIQGQLAVVEGGIRRGEEAQAVLSRLPEIEAALTALFQAIDGQAAGGEATVQGQEGDEAMPELIAQAKAELAEFDSHIDVTLGKLRARYPADGPIAEAFSAIARKVERYDYEAALRQFEELSGRL